MCCWVILSRRLFCLLSSLTLLTSGILALEIQEQCSIESGPNRRLATVRGTISYQIKRVEVPPDFWKEGVGTSKRIINRILKKITSYEDDMSQDLNEDVQGKIIKRFKKIDDENLWFDAKKKKSVNKEAFCATVGEMKAKERKSLKYNCQESEQLYGIGYHRVYEDCKDDPFLGQFSVDWSICLHAHYQWVDMTEWSICVIKSYKNDFLACFCKEENSKLSERSFCITKFECFLHGQGLSQYQTSLFVTDPCKNSVQYFMEVNVKSKKSFKKAQQLDKLRVRALYHPESPCKDQQFSAQFDVGQLDTENLDSGIEVHVPNLVKYQMVPDEPQDPPRCSVPYDEEEEEKIDPIVRQSLHMLDEILKERLITSMVIWIPGIFFLYSNLSSEKSNIQRLLVQVVQCKLVILGLYNLAMAPTLWRSKLFSKGQFGEAEIFFFACSVLLTIWLNKKEIAELFLFYSIIYSVPTLICANLSNKLRSREALTIVGILALLYYTGCAVLLIFKVKRCLHLIKIMNIPDEHAADNQRRKENPKRKNAKKKKNNDKNMTRDFEKMKPKLMREESKRETALSCSWKCNNYIRTNYISLNCSRKCIFYFHLNCWNLYLIAENLTEEQKVFYRTCITSNCDGFLLKIIRFDQFGAQLKISMGKNKCKTKSNPTFKPETKTEKEQQDVLKEEDDDSPPEKFDETVHEMHGKTKESLEISKQMLTAMDFEKIYQHVGSSKDIPFEEEIDKECLQPKNFGTIGSERKLKECREPINLLEESAILLDSQNQLSELFCNTSLDLMDSDNGPRKSKLLLLMKKTENLEDDQMSSLNIGPPKDGAPSQSVTYYPNLESRNTSNSMHGIDVNAQSITYLSGITSSHDCSDLNSENCLQANEKLIPIATPDASNMIVDDESFETCCPFTKMIKRKFPIYEVKSIETAVQDLMAELNHSYLTIPEFQKKVIEKLEKGLEVDETAKEEVDECLICTDLLEENLISLEPCEHIFHGSCIEQWLHKDKSCPKCRANVVHVKK